MRQSQTYALFWNRNERLMGQWPGYQTSLDAKEVQTAWKVANIEEHIHKTHVD